ncbi:hypothetical protein LTR37_020083 [Vermiconidia calcicola]|uniref:Uncharacterized protein n=1 Tax=Vermiconidia calcicola TaxID=1690605 RepID=A0ACC3MCA3_9PEZI|nr:hypothetical protein LTR37_020083 [Vermiconidia calcicola]
MNIDGLSQRAAHPKDQLLELHGSLFDLKCFNEDCDYIEIDNFDPNIIPQLKRAAESSATALPRCPKRSSLLLPNIVWFGENLPSVTVAEADSFIEQAEQIDLMLVIGTTAQVWPASGYVDSAIEKGARVAMVNIDRGDLVPGGGELGLTHRDWFFVGDAASIVPEMLKPVVGDL